MPYRRRKYTGGFSKIKLKKKTFQALTGLIFILAAGLTLLSLFSVSPPAVLLHEQIVKYFGFITPLIPIALAVAGLFLLKVKLPVTGANSVAGFYLFLLSVLSLVAVFSPSKGGVVGQSIAETLSLTLSKPGAFFTFFILILVSIVVFFNTSLETLINFLGITGSATTSFLKAVFAKKEGEEEKEPTFTTRGLNDQAKAEKEEDFPDIKAPITNLPGSEDVWEYPSVDLLTDSLGAKATRGDIKQSAAVIEKTLESFGIQAKVVEVNMGPAVTQYALEIALGTKLTKITSLANDIALALAAPTGTVRIEAPIPGKSLVGIEVPNLTLEIVPLKNVLTSTQMQKAKSRVELALGLDVSGQSVVDDLARMPHMLIAGSTGSGKSVAINAFIATILFRASPSEVKFILVDPKIVELSNWNGIPHLLAPVINEAEKVLSALRWAIGEMEKRYKLFAEIGARNINMYNEMSGFQALPYIVIIIDELADIMLFAPVEVEDAITRLAQMSRAVGIHMILATQRPSVDVLTGLIKANIPCRVSFNVTSQIDSRVIIDQVGSEKLLGRGDMLYVPPDASKPSRIQGVFVSEPEINRLIDFLKKSGIGPQYTEEVTTTPVSKLVGKKGTEDELFEDAVKAVVQYDRASASLLQRRLRIGYARAARLLDELEAAGVVGVADGSKARDVLIKDAERVIGGSVKEEPEKQN
jgi:S-DNA-T family DNA segregation ATPase FtsK/SpoIIIE